MSSFGLSMPTLQTEMRKFGDLARMADDAGFRSLWDYEAYRNPFVIHAITALTTKRIQLATGIAQAFARSPFEAANAAADVDEISGGRAILGVGAGHVRGEFEALGIDFATRGRRLDEILAALRGAFSERYVSHAGEFYRYARVGVAPQPQRELPIWVGGRGRAAWRRAGRFGDGWIPMANERAEYPEALDAMRAAARAAGRGDVAFDVGYMPPWSYLLGSVPRELPATGLAGGAAALAEDLRAARAAGANVFHLKFRARDLPEYLAQLDAFADEVLPLVKRG